MKAEKLAAILTKRHAGKEVLVFDTQTSEFISLEAEDITPAFTGGPDTIGVHDLVVLEDDSEDSDGLSKAVVLWKS